jgi:hypothetical protein
MSCACKPDSRGRLPYDRMCPEHANYHRELHEKAILQHKAERDPDTVMEPVVQ